MSPWTRPNLNRHVRRHRDFDIGDFHSDHNDDNHNNHLHLKLELDIVHVHLAFWCSDIAGIPARQCGQSYVRTSLVFGCSNNNLNASMIWYPCANCTCLGSSVYYNYSVGDCYPQGSFGEAYYCSQSIPQYSVATRLRPSTALQVSLAMFVILVTVVL
ncbi:hypothetical protein HK105_204716 [Polyrhizophydium stewartii]|uniref:Uncharacterized protein n=1 Tax=Polyrhizophydium stewartii TaxID=2732419 RepID=A0ABR4N8I3_9FUNG